ncbi:Gfo/Idh/MocA family protein [Paenibacillus sp. y28]|uniref:Gfo/Idh/MocA family protein n=1 Tax=Paenibacillus sp. y28 TaxID=3129110 RepID=UPI0030196504
MDKLRVGLIGCGAITIHRHAPEYAMNPKADIAAFCDLVQERADKLAAEYGGKGYTSYEEMLVSEGLDAVSVCTSNADHAKVSIAALRHGVHVLCEKPMAVSETECQAMIEAAQENNAFLMIGHNQRLMPAHVKAKELLQSGMLGRVLTFRTAFGHPGPEGWSVEGKEGWFFRKNRAFVGAMGDLGVHKADLIRWLLADEVAEVGAFVDTLHKEGTDVDDNAICILRMRSGAIGTLAASWTYYRGEDNSTVLYCENGVIKIGTDPVHQVIVELRNGHVERHETGAIATNDGQTHSGVIDAFVSAVLAGMPPAISGEEGRRSLRVILAALESAETGQFVKVRQD